MQIRRKSNQRITKVKFDKLLSLLNKAEKMTPEEGTTIVSTIDDLIPYPEYSKLRFWTRDNILKGLNGAIITASPNNSENFIQDDTKQKTISYNVLLDGLILSVPEYKTVTLYNDTGGNPVYELAPKPGLQLSNFFKTLNYTPSSNQETVDTYFEIAYKKSPQSTNWKKYLPNIIGSNPSTVALQGLLWQTLEAEKQAVKYQYCIQPKTSYFTEAFLTSATYANAYPQNTLDTPAKQWSWLEGTSGNTSNYRYRYTGLYLLYCNYNEDINFNGKTAYQGGGYTTLNGVISTMPDTFTEVTANKYDIARLDYTNRVFGTLIHTSN